ncbi:hypothetical protein JCM11251_000584 [Rhodosporidiobolus azoricus]
MSTPSPQLAGAPTEQAPLLPPYLFDYLQDSPLPVAVYSHADLQASAASDSPCLPSPAYQCPALEAFLYQGAGGAALLAQQQLRLKSRIHGSKVDKEKEKTKEAAIQAARAKAPKDLTSALDEAAKEPFRRWLLDGIAHATGAGSGGVPTTSGSFPSSRSRSPSVQSASSLHRPSISTTQRAPSISSSRGTFGSANSASSGYASFRQTPLQLRSEIHFAKTWWRAQINLDLGVTIMTQLPATSVANGGQVSLTGSEDGGGTGSVSGTLVDRSEDGGKSTPHTPSEGWPSSPHPAPVKPLDDLAEETSSQLDDLVDAANMKEWVPRREGAGKGVPTPAADREGAGKGVPTPAAEKQEKKEKGKSTQDEKGVVGVGDKNIVEGEERGALSALSSETDEDERSSHVELLGEVEVSVEGARDPCTLEGMAFTLWNAPVGLFRVNTDLALTQCNPIWRRTAGLQPGETNDAWPARVHPDDRPRVIAHYQQIAQDLPWRRDQCEFRWLPEGDADQWCVCTIVPCVIDGRLEGYNGMLENINDHKAAATASELRAMQLREELAVLSDTTTVGLVRINLEGKFLQANKAWYDIVKLEPGRPLDEWVNWMHPDVHDSVMEQWAEALRTREPLNIRIKWRDGDVCLVQAVLNNSNKEEATGWIGSVTDVTPQAQAEQAVLNLSKEREARAKHEAAEAEERRKVAVEEKRQQELLIDVTSHEIRNPISAILQNSDFTRSSLQSLRSTLLSLRSSQSLPPELDNEKLFNDLEEDIEALDSITECGLAQERIANDILGLAQIQLSKYSITPVEFDLATSLRNICRMFKSECRSKGIELKLVIGSSLARLGPRARVFADPARLTQVLVNLLSNAIRFTAKSAVRQVTLAVEVSGRPPERDTPLVPPRETELHIDKQKPVYLFFSVEDTGPGMTQEETGRLFAKFMQASPFTHTTWGGSGLGLWIARNLCELQAGRIEVASTVGKGSIFRCFITARSVDAGLKHNDPTPVAVIEGITAPNAARGATPTVYLANTGESSTPLKGLTILCCEDNQINRTVLKRQLLKEGCDAVLLACDGQEGLDILNARQPGEIDCILMDIEMPVMDGLAATRAIRTAEQQGQRSGHQRIVGLTGNARNAQKDAALDAGMDTVITTPYKVPDLIEKIRNDHIPNALGSSTNLLASNAGAGSTATFMAASPGVNEQTFAFGNGISVEVITCGSPTSSASSRLADESTSPTRKEGRRGSFVSEGQAPPSPGLPQKAEEATHSMAHHGEGQLLPRSQSPERSLEK